MTRKQALEAIKVAGAEGDTARYIRLYAENRISYQAAKEAYLVGAAFGRWVATRNASHDQR